MKAIRLQGAAARKAAIGRHLRIPRTINNRASPRINPSAVSFRFTRCVTKVATRLHLDTRSHSSLSVHIFIPLALMTSHSSFHSILIEKIYKSKRRGEVRRQRKIKTNSIPVIKVAFKFFLSRPASEETFNVLRRPRRSFIKCRLIRAESS
jgi:hypothetical protein